MSTYEIITDSTCDLTQELLDQNHILYAPMHYCIGEEEFAASANWQSHSAKEYYDMLRNGIRITTTQVPKSTYESLFEAAFKAEKDVLYIACSSALSGSVHTAVQVAKELEEKYPDRKAVCIDSLISSLGEGYLTLVAANNRDNGMSLTDNASAIEGMKLTVNQVATVETLEYLKRAGRVTATSAFFGNFMGIKPILISDRKGQNLAVKKVKGSAAAYREMARYLSEHVINPEDQTLYISHADSLESAEAVKKEILAVAPFKNVFIHYIAPIVGASVGPGTIIAFYLGKEVMEEGATK